MNEPLDIVIVDDNEERLRDFCSILGEYTQFRNIHHAPDYSKALHKMGTLLSCDAVLVFDESDLKKITKFVEKARETDSGSICSFILVVRPEEALVQEIDKYASAGIDGFLFQPVDDSKITSITVVIKKSLQEHKEALEKKLQYKGASELLRRKYEAKKKQT